ncbi:hypothetical protein ABZ671_01250 [Micromonospora sp. NPDC006766]|uniref:hypothetical protein n=1 Tax=Micromonospora sp. NPDC006766 TaxID=3154778 RepID=UPI0033D71009
MTGLTGWWRRRVQQRRTRYRLNIHQTAARRFRHTLARTARPADRSRTLLNLATATTCIAIATEQADGGVRWLPDEKQSVRMSLTYEANLYRALSDADWSAAHGIRRHPAAPSIELAAGCVLDQIAADPAGSRNPELIVKLREAVTPVVGARAAASALTGIGGGR